MNQPTPTLRVHVDLTNPGQFFACCGLLELAARIAPRAAGRFSDIDASLPIFEIALPNSSAALFLDTISDCKISSTLAPEQISRLKTLLNAKKTDLTKERAAEKALLSELWEKERVFLRHPRELLALSLDWWRDDDTGGSRLKTWAGKQLVTDILQGVHAPLRKLVLEGGELTELLSLQLDDGSLPFYFDSTFGSHSSSIDVGFSLDALSVRGAIKPATEFFAFVGLQRFRPSSSDEVYIYRVWLDWLPPELAAAVTCGACDGEPIRSFGFPLLYRTKYLKAFLPAVPAFLS